MLSIDLKRILLVTSFVYLPVLFSGYLNYDDPGWLLNGPEGFPPISASSILACFRRSVAGNWCPLTNLTFLLDQHVFGFRPIWSHALSLILHLINIVLLYRLMSGAFVSQRRAVFICALFALHPVNVEAVAWVSDRKGLLSTTFLLLCISAYAKHANSRSRAFYWQSVAWYALSLAAKPSVLMLPAVLLALDVWPFERAGRVLERLPWLLLEKIPFFCLSALDALAVCLAQRNADGIANHSVLYNVETAIVGLARYASNVLLPIDLNAVYYNPGSWRTLTVGLSFVLILLVTVLTALLWRRKKAFLVCWVSFILAMTPVLQLIPAGRTYMADRYAYVPYIWLFLAISLCTDHKLARTVMVRVAVCLIALLMSLQTSVQAHTWRNTGTVCQRALKVEPRNPVAHLVAAHFYAQTGEKSAAIEHVREAVRLAPSDAILRGLAAEAFAVAGSDGEALDSYEVLYAQTHPARFLASYASLLAASHSVANPAKSLRLAREAVKIDRSPRNVLALALALEACGQKSVDR